MSRSVLVRSRVRGRVLAVLLVGVVLVMVVSGCLGGGQNQEPGFSTTYRVEVWSEGPVTVYLPVPYDSPERDTAGLVGRLEVGNKSYRDEVYFRMVNTTRGRALRVEKTGDVDHVVLKARGGNEYFEKYPGDFGGSTAISGPTYFNFSMPVNHSDSSGYECYVYLEPASSPGDARINIRIDTDAPGHFEKLVMRNGTVGLQLGWQKVQFDHIRGIY